MALPPGCLDVGHGIDFKNWVAKHAKTRKSPQQVLRFKTSEKNVQKRFDLWKIDVFMFEMFSRTNVPFAPLNWDAHGTIFSLHD